jgi:hypothetical protein
MRRKKKISFFLECERESIGNSSPMVQIAIGNAKRDYCDRITFVNMHNTLLGPRYKRPQNQALLLVWLMTWNWTGRNLSENMT